MPEELPASRPSRLEPLSVLWRAFAAPQTLIVLVGLLAVALSLGTIVPQVPPQAIDDPQVWLAVQPDLLLGSNGLAQVLGLHDVFHAYWFRFLLVLIGLALFVRMVEGADLARRTLGQDGWDVDAFAFWGARLRRISIASVLSPEDVPVRLDAFFTRRGYKWTRVSDVAVPSFVTHHRGLALWVQPVLLGALLLALLGLMVVGTWGWQGAVWQPAPGETWAVGRGTGYEVRLDMFEPQVDGGSWPGDSESRVSWFVDGMPLQQAVVSFGQPAKLRGLAVRQLGYVPVVRLRGWDEDGSQLVLQPAGEGLARPGEVEIVFPSTEAQPLILVPSQDLILALSFDPPGVDEAPALQVAVLRVGGSETLPLGVLHESGSVSFDSSRFDIDLAYRPVLRVDSRPAMGLVVAGMALALIALTVAWIVPPRLLWIAVGPGEESPTLIEVLAPAGTGTGKWFRQLASQLREAVTSDD
jgi:hypothetical protein